MPIYEYSCQNCGHRIEVMHGVHAARPEACSKCGGPLRKLLSPPAIVFKGSGWAKKERSSSSAARPTVGGDMGKEKKGGEAGSAATGPSTAGAPSGSSGGQGTES